MAQSTPETISLSQADMTSMLGPQGHRFITAMTTTLARQIGALSSVRIEFPQQQSPKNLLSAGQQNNLPSHEIKSRIGKILNGSCHMRFAADGSLEVGPALPRVSPQKLASEVNGHVGNLVRRPESVHEVSEEEWAEHLLYSKSCLRDKAKEESLTPDVVGNRLRGRCAEFVLQQLLNRYASSHRQGIHFATRDDRMTLPSPQSSFSPEHTLHFTTRYNCELHQRSSVASAHQTIRHTPLQASKTILTEFDALMMTGMGAANPTGHDRMYILDATTSGSGFGSRMFRKSEQLRSFSDSMQASGIEVHQFHVYMYSPASLRKVNEIRNLGDARNHVIALPIVSLVDHVAKRTANELQLKMT